MFVAVMFFTNLVFIARANNRGGRGILSCTPPVGDLMPRARQGLPQGSIAVLYTLDHTCN